MKVTALEEYGLRCMVLFVQKGADQTLTLPEISSTEGLSIPYAGKLLMILKQAGLVKAVRGRKGGYRLAKAPEEMFLREIFDALGEPLYGPHHCNRYSGENDICAHKDCCTVGNIWHLLNSFIVTTFDKVTLADLVLGNYSFPNLTPDEDNGSLSENKSIPESRIAECDIESKAIPQNRTGETF